MLAVLAAMPGHSPSPGCELPAPRRALRPPGARRPPLREPVRLPVRGQVPSCYRVVQPQHPILAFVPKVEPEHLAVHHDAAARQHRHRRQGPVLAVPQSVSLKRRRQILPPRVVQKVLRHPQRGIDLPLAPLVLAPGARRGHLQHEVRPLGLVPQQVRVAQVARRPHHHVDVRRHHRPGVAPLVVHERVRTHVHVLLPASLVAPLEGVEHVLHAREVNVGLSHGLAVGAGILDDIVRDTGLAHRRALRGEAGVSFGTRPPGR